MRRLLGGFVLASVAALTLAAGAAAREVRVFTVSPRFGLDWVDTREHFRGKLMALADAGLRTPGAPVQAGLGDVRTRLRGPQDRGRAAATARDLITLPEDLGLLAAFSGSRGAGARASDGLIGAIGALIGSYAPVAVYYGAKYPSLPARAAPPTRLLSVALTDTFVRVGVESFAELADTLDAYVVAGVTLAQDWQVVCTDKATYLPPPGAGPCAVQDAERVALLRSPDEPARTYAYEATSPKPSTMALVFDPDGRLVGKTVKAYLTPIELPGGLDLVPGDVDGVRVVPTPVGRLGIVTSKDAWMPDITRKLDQQRVEILVQPEFFVGSTVAASGPWNPDTLRGSGPSDVQRHPSVRALALPQLVGNVFDFSADAQAAIVTRTRRTGAFVGQPVAPGFAAVAPWVIPEPGGTVAERRRALGMAGEALRPGGPPCAVPQTVGACAGGHAESVLAADVTVGAAPAYSKAAVGSGARPFAPARAISGGRAAQRNVALAARGRTVWAAWEQRQAGEDAVLIARSTDGGRRFGTPFAVAPGWWPALSVGPDGRVWAAWEHRGRVRVASAADGRRFSAPRTLPGVAAQHKPAIAATGRGRALIAWVDDRGRSRGDKLPQAGLYGARLRAGRTFETPRPEAPRRLDATSGAAPAAAELDHAWAPALAARGSRVSLAWVDFRGYDWSVFARDSGDGGARFGPERRVNTQPEAVEALDDAPALALTATGRRLLAFTDWVNPADSDRTPSGLYDTRLAYGSAAPRQIDGDRRAHRSTFSPAVAAVGQDALVAWQDGQADAVEVARAGAAGAGRSWRVAPGGSRQYRPALAVSGLHAILAWEDHRDGPSRIYVTRGAVRRLR